MEPLYKRGSLILIDTSFKLEDVKEGDVLVYQTDNNDLIMHRLIRKNTFKGDANQTEEHVLLTDRNLIGKATSFILPDFDLIVEHQNAFRFFGVLFFAFGFMCMTYRKLTKKYE